MPRYDRESEMTRVFEIGEVKDYLFHVKSAMKGTVIGIIVAMLSGVIILLVI